MPISGDAHNLPPEKPKKPSAGAVIAFLVIVLVAGVLLSNIIFPWWLKFVLMLP